jgi:ABC-type multidrug transport system fused ATPase/permease subunit
VPGDRRSDGVSRADEVDVVAAPERTTHGGLGALGSLWHFRRYGRPHVMPLVGGIGLRAGELVADLAQPWPLAIIVDTVLGTKPLHGVAAAAFAPFSGSKQTLLAGAALSALAIAVVSGALDYLGDRVMNGAGERITAAIRADLFGHLQRLPLAYHDGHQVGELASRVSSDTANIEDALVDVFSTLLPGVMTVAGLALMTLVLNWHLGLVAFAATPVVAVVFARYTRLTRTAARARREREGRLTAQVVEVLSGIRTVLALGRHEVHDEQFADGNARTLEAGLRSVDLRARLTPLVEASAAVGTAALLGVGAWGVMRGAWSLGLLLVVASSARNMLKPIRSLSSLSLSMSRAAASAERVLAVLDEPLPVGPARRPRARKAVGRIELRDVTFGYGRGRVLERVALVVEPGTRLAVLGPNGAGKSSLLALLARLYEPDEGDVLLDGISIDALPLSWLRSQLAVVPQDTFLFSGTLRQNIAYGRPGAKNTEIMDAARRALVDEFARDLPDGYDTMLGDRGSGLSGGQRQRVAIARALLRDAPIVLLDEPTSGLDLKAERTVVKALRTLVQGRTVVMVTHRPALVDLADSFVSIENGRVIQHGRPRLQLAASFER